MELSEGRRTLAILLSRKEVKDDTLMAKGLVGMLWWLLM